MPAARYWVDDQGVPVRIFGQHGSRRRRDYIFMLGVVWTLIARRRTYDLVYFLMPGIQLVGGLPTARFLRKRILMKFSGSNEVSKLQKTFLGRMVLFFLRRWADRVILLNPGMLEETRIVHLSRGLCWLPNPVDTSRFHPVDEGGRNDRRMELSLPLSAPVVCYVGRLSREKNLFPLIEAFARLQPGFPEALLVLVGDGPERAGIEARLESLGTKQRVLITGFVDSETVLRWLQASDVFALVSSLEGLPVSLIEGMAVGLPSVVSDIPGVTQVVDHEVHGLVTRLNDVEGIAQALGRLLGDASLRRRLGEQSRERALERFSLEIVAGQYERLFQEVLERSDKAS
jgi:glycosyltransferase involved in cell wall biosynthesis